VAESNREPQGRTGPIHRSPATEAGNDSKKECCRRERPMTVQKVVPRLVHLRALVTDPPALLRSNNAGIVVSRALNG